MNKFSNNIKNHDSNTIEYNTFSLPTSIVQCVKRTTRPTLTENYEEAISIENDLHVVGVITNDESTKDSKDASNRSQASMRKAKEKEPNDIIFYG